MSGELSPIRPGNCLPLKTSIGYCDSQNIELKIGKGTDARSAGASVQLLGS